jgi:hypothetical protein
MAVGMFQKLSNTKSEQIVKTVMWDGQVHYTDSVTLNPFLYDHTIVYFDKDLSASDALSKFRMTVQEGIGSSRKSVSFRMSDFRDGETDYSNEAIFYPSTFNRESDGRYSISIYIAARCSNAGTSVGFNDCTVAIESDELDLYVSYRTWLPPVIEQGLPVKKNPSEEDPVFPADANRTDIGAGYLSDYMNNAHGYSEDYFFSNSEPLYEVTASGFIPSSLQGNSFTEVQSRLVNTITSMEVPIAITGQSRETKDVEVLKSSTYGSMTDTFEITKFVQSLKSDTYKNRRGTIKNKLVITGVVYNSEDPEEENCLLTQSYENILTQNGDNIYY